MVGVVVGVAVVVAVGVVVVVGVGVGVGVGVVGHHKLTREQAMGGQKWVVNSEHTRDQLHKHIDRMFDEHKYLVVSDIKTSKQRTSRQNAALHVYLTQLSTALNDAGLDMKKALKPNVDIPWNKDLAKEYLWRPIQKALLNKNSTTKAERTEYTEVYETLNRHTAEKWGVSLPWPERDSNERD